MKILWSCIGIVILAVSPSFAQQPASPQAPTQGARGGMGMAQRYTMGDQPAPQAGNATFDEGHANLVAKAKAGGIDLYFQGDSITRRWQATHQENWDANFTGWKAADFGSGGDTTRNVLWRMQNGEFDGVNPKVLVLLIGTNNVGFNPPPAGSETALVDDTVKGIKAILDLIRQKSPSTKIVLVAITPRNTNGTTELMPIINRINDGIKPFADGKTIRYLNINDKLADKSGKVLDGVTEDGLHLSNAGYQILADGLKPILTEWLGAPKK